LKSDLPDFFIMVECYSAKKRLSFRLIGLWAHPPFPGLMAYLRRHSLRLLVAPGFAQISPFHEKCQNGESFFPEMEIKTNPQKNHYLRQKAMLCML